MRNIIALAFVILLCVCRPDNTWSSAIVTAASERDSLSLPFAPLDSTGNAVDLADGDSVYVVVFSPGGDVVFKDSMAYNAAYVKYCDWEDYAGGRAYVYRRRVDDLNGASTAKGVFSYLVETHDRTSANLRTRYTGWFQIVSSPLETSLDSASMAFVTARQIIDSLNIVVDSLYAVLDTLQHQDDWVSKHTPADVADTLFGRDSNLYAEGFWHKLAHRSDSGSVTSGPDSATMARWVWNTPHANHVTTGTFGEYLDARVSGIGSGSGIYAYSLAVIDASIAQVIPGARVVVRNLEQTSLVAVGVTASDGRVSFNLDSDSFLVAVAAPGYIFDPYDTIVVQGAGVDSIFGDQFDPGLPAVAGLCRVYGYLYDVQGNPEAGATIKAYLPSGVVRYQNLIVSPFSVSVTSDATGYFYLDLIPSDSLTPLGSKYEFSITRSDGTILRQRLVVPAVSSWQLVW